MRLLLLGALLWLSACSSPTVRPQPDATTAEEPGTPQPRRTATRTPWATAKASLTPVVNPAPTSAIWVQATDLKGVKVQFWHPLNGEALLALEQLVREFNRDNSWGVEVQLSGYGGFGALDEKVRQSSPQDLPQILVGYPAQALAWDGEKLINLLDLQPYLNDPVWGFSAVEQTDFLPAAWMQDVYSGLDANGSARRLGLPWYRSARLLLYNSTWAEELGYAEAPASLQQFESQACAAANALKRDSDVGNDGRGGWLAQAGPGDLGPWIWAYGGEFFDAEGYQYTSQAALKAAGDLSGWIHKGCAWSSSDLYPFEALAQRQALFWIAGPQEALALQEALTAAGSSDQWLALTLPSAQEQPALATSGPALLALSSAPEKQLAAWVFMRWLNSAENQARWAGLTGSYPSRFSAADLLQDDRQMPEVWKSGLELLQYARSEPTFASWERVRWAEAEALQQLLANVQPAPAATTVLTVLNVLAEELNSLP